MSGNDPDEDERTVHDRLVALVDGPPPDAVAPAPIPPKPIARPRDWLDDLLDDNDTPRAAAEDPEPDPEAETEPEAGPERAVKPKKPKAKATRKARRRPKRHAPDAPRSAWDNQAPDPRQSLLDAWAAVPYRLKWLYCHLAAAAAGWQLGLVTWATHTAAWYAAGHWTSGSAWVLYVLAGLLAALYRIASKWAWPVRLLASIPTASVVVGLLLYGTDYLNLRIPL